MHGDRELLPFSRWWLVGGGAIAMGMAGTYQFVWSSIRSPLGVQIGASEATLGTLFTLLIVSQTLSQFPTGWFRDRYGPRLPLVAGAILLAGGYAGLAVAPTPTIAAIAVIVGGTGAGATYTVAVNTPVKWFETHRGLATGVVTMMYSGLSVVLIPVIRGDVVMVFETTMLVFAVLGAAACLVGAFVLRDPPSDEFDPESRESTIDDGADIADSPTYTWRESMRTWQFWVLYVVFAVVNGVGLMLIGKVIAFADSLGLSAAAATGAASIIAFADGAGVLIGGGISDRLGSVRTVGWALIVSAAGIASAVVVGGHGFAGVFVVLVGVAAFFRSPVFAVFPSLIGEYYGTAHSSENYAMLYTGKVWGSIFAGTVTSILIASLGWTQSFFLGAGLLALAGIATLSVRPVDHNQTDRR